MVASEQDLLIHASEIHPSLLDGLVPVDQLNFVDCEGNIKCCQGLSRTFTLTNVLDPSPEKLKENLELIFCIVKVLKEYNAVYFCYAGVQINDVSHVSSDIVSCEVSIRYSY